MSVPPFLLARELGRGGGGHPRRLLERRLGRARALHRRDLLGHFGCVNAVEFGPEGGDLLASGGDDHRVLVWSVGRAVLDRYPEEEDGGKEEEKKKRARPAAYAVMEGRHNSNIFCLDFDPHRGRVFSGGNDEQVLAHDLATGRALDAIQFVEPVYCVAASPSQPGLLATACADGAVRLHDLRRDNAASDPTDLASHPGYPFYSAAFNPAEPRLVVTANQRHGVGLWDLRRPGREVLRYGEDDDDGLNPRSRQSAMSARFDGSGRRILALRRRQPPVVFRTESRDPAWEFDHPGYFNSCTMKSCSFAGAGDEYVMSGSDDFNVYLWRIPEDDGDNDLWVDRADLVLRGHRSIVNQVRFSKPLCAVASAGVEKVVKLWSVLPLPTAGDEEGEADTSSDRLVYPRNSYLSMREGGDPFRAHDYSAGSTEENPRMMAFFDSLVQREADGPNLNTSSEEAASRRSEDSSEEEEGEEPGPRRISQLIAKQRRRKVARDARRRRIEEAWRRRGPPRTTGDRAARAAYRHALATTREESSTSSSPSYSSSSDDEDLMIGPRPPPGFQRPETPEALRSRPPGEEVDAATREDILRSLRGRARPPEEDSDNDEVSPRVAFKKSRGAGRRCYRRPSGERSD